MAWNNYLTIEKNNESYVCTALTLSGFAETQVNGDDELGVNKGAAPSLEEFKKHLRYCVQQHDESADEDSGGYPYYDDSVYRVAVIQAYTVHTQPVSEGYLEQLGFQRFGPVSKLKHPKTKLSVWLITATDFLEAIKESS